LLRRLVRGVLGDQAAFDGGFEHAGPVALQLSLDAPQRGRAGVELREQRLDLLHDALLLGERG